MRRRNLEEAISQHKTQIEIVKQRLRCGPGQADHRSFFVSYALVPASISEPNELSQSQLAREVKQLSANPSFETAHHGMHTFLESAARALCMGEHPGAKGPEFEIAAAEAKRVQQILKDLLGWDISWELDSVGSPKCVFNSRRFDPAELSEGQRMLLSWAISLHAQGAERLSGALLFVDEPERNLHPKAALDILGHLLQAVGPDGQLFIATHSPNVLAWARHFSIYAVNAGAVTYASGNLKEAIEGLLGGPKGREELRQVLSDADSLAFAKFAAESLFEAGVADVAAGDPQIGQFTEFCSRRATPSAPIRVLDYAAGHARFAAGIVGLKDEIKSCLRYTAYNDGARGPHSEECLANLRLLYAEAALQHAISDLSVLWEEKDRVDVVVMCNLLHEIPVGEWVWHFAAAQKVLKDDGTLLIMEDLEIGIGELPHKGGFLVLTLQELRSLFRLGESLRQFGKGRLSAVGVPAADLKRCTKDSLRETLIASWDRVLKEVESVRASADTSHRAGRKHALCTIQLANVALALKSIGETLAVSPGA